MLSPRMTPAEGGFFGCGGFGVSGLHWLRRNKRFIRWFRSLRGFWLRQSLGVLRSLDTFRCFGLLRCFGGFFFGGGASWCGVRGGDTRQDRLLKPHHSLLESPHYIGPSRQRGLRGFFAWFGGLRLRCKCGANTPRHHIRS